MLVCLLRQDIKPSMRFLCSNYVVTTGFQVVAVRRETMEEATRGFIVYSARGDCSRGLFEELSRGLSNCFRFRMFRSVRGLGVTTGDVRMGVLLVKRRCKGRSQSRVPTERGCLLVNRGVPGREDPARVPFFQCRDIDDVLRLLLRRGSRRGSRMRARRVRLISSESRAIGTGMGNLVKVCSPIRQVKGAEFTVHVKQILSRSVPALCLGLRKCSKLGCCLPRRSKVGLKSLLCCVGRRDVGPM